MKEKLTDVIVATRYSIFDKLKLKMRKYLSLLGILREVNLGWHFVALSELAEIDKWVWSLDL